MASLYDNSYDLEKEIRELAENFTFCHITLRLPGIELEIAHSIKLAIIFIIIRALKMGAKRLHPKAAP